MSARTEQIALWVLEALEAEWEREPNLLKCRTEDSIFAELMARRDLEITDLNRAIRFLISFRGIKAVNRQDGRATLPSEKGLEYLASHRSPPRGGQEQPAQNLSDQAVSILQQFVESGGGDLIYRDWGEGRWTLQIDNLCQVGVTEPRFIQDDLNRLIALDFLRTEFGPDGNPICHVTRDAARFIAGVNLHSGQSLGRWVLQEVIGQGGNGVVWSAKDSSNRSVAIKFLQPDFFGKQREQRFRDEIEFLHRESSRPGILPMIDYHLPMQSGVDGRPWFSTPFAQCFTKLALAGPAKLEKVVAYIERIARTLAKLHDEGKWHRDLKPDNLFILNELPVIGDFGLVHFPGKDANTRESENLGSRNYTAPELEGDAGRVSAGPGDVYSLAKTLWVLTSGKPHPPPGQLRIDTSELRFSNVCTHSRSHVLDILLERSTSHSPMGRPTMQEFAEELTAWLNLPNPLSKTSPTPGTS